jgi:hypothetical protein
MSGDIPFEVYMKELVKFSNWDKKIKVLDDNEKKFIIAAKKKGATIVSIAKVLKRNRTTIYNFLNSLD